MILEANDILDIINNRPYYDVITAAQAQYEKLYMHYTGDGIEQYVEDMEEFMREGTKETLIKLMRGNRDLIHRVMNPRNKIYTAKGGMQQINLPEDLQTEFAVFLSKIAEGLPMDEWIRQRVQPRYDYDPNGLVQIEINSDGIPYPKVRCIMEIYDYMRNGRALEYVVFECSDAEVQAYIKSGVIYDSKTKLKVYRVIDDTTDRIVVFGNRMGRAKYSIDNMQIASELPNEFGYVPCIIISDIFGTKQIMDSPLSVCIDLLDDMLTDQALYSWAYWRNAFPKEWMQIMKCPTCAGYKEVDGLACPECHGNGYAPFMRTSDVARIDYKADENKSIPNPPIGVIQPPIEALQFMVDNNTSLEDYFSYTMWGVQKVQGSNAATVKPAGKGGNVSGTAYEAQQNEQPQHDRLKLFGNWKVSIQRFIIDCCAWYLYRELFDGSAIICGDRFMIESPDATWDRYLKAVQGKAPMYTLDTLLIEYNENKFAGNNEAFRKAELLRQVEPFVHEDVAVIWIDMTLPLTLRLMKKYFDEWTSTLTNYDIASVPDEGGADILRQQLLLYVQGRYISEKKQDALLLTATGEIINIGDQVKIVHGMERKSDHLGQIFTVTDIADRNVTIKGGGMDGVFGYTIDQLYKATQIKIN